MKKSERPGCAGNRVLLLAAAGLPLLLAPTVARAEAAASSQPAKSATGGSVISRYFWSPEEGIALLRAEAEKLLPDDLRTATVQPGPEAKQKAVAAAPVKNERTASADPADVPRQPSYHVAVTPPVATEQAPAAAAPAAKEVAPQPVEPQMQAQTADRAAATAPLPAPEEAAKAVVPQAAAPSGTADLKTAKAESPAASESVAEAKTSRADPAPATGEPEQAPVTAAPETSQTAKLAAAQMMAGPRTASAGERGTYIWVPEPGSEAEARFGQGGVLPQILANVGALGRTDGRWVYIPYTPGAMIELSALHDKIVEAPQHGDWVGEGNTWVYVFGKAKSYAALAGEDENTALAEANGGDQTAADATVGTKAGAETGAKTAAKVEANTAAPSAAGSAAGKTDRAVAVTAEPAATPAAPSTPAEASPQVAQNNAPASAGAAAAVPDAAVASAPEKAGEQAPVQDRGTTEVAKTPGSGAMAQAVMPPAEPQSGAEAENRQGAAAQSSAPTAADADAAAEPLAGAIGGAPSGQWLTVKGRWIYVTLGPGDAPKLSEPAMVAALEALVAKAPVAGGWTQQASQWVYVAPQSDAKGVDGMMAPMAGAKTVPVEKEAAPASAANEKPAEKPAAAPAKENDAAGYQTGKAAAGRWVRRNGVWVRETDEAPVAEQSATAPAPQEQVPTQPQAQAQPQPVQAQSAPAQPAQPKAEATETEPRPSLPGIAIVGQPAQAPATKPAPAQTQPSQTQPSQAQPAVPSAANDKAASGWVLRGGAWVYAPPAGSSAMATPPQASAEPAAPQSSAAATPPAKAAAPAPAPAAAKTPDVMFFVPGAQSGTGEWYVGPGNILDGARKLGPAGPR